MFNKYSKHLIVTFFCLLALSGCATAPYVKPAAVSYQPLPGIYHTVEKGQTLWRISKSYGVDLDELVKANNIGEDANIEVGQKLLIPGRARPQAIPVKYSGSDVFLWPLKGKVVSSFGQTFSNMVNKGINIAPYAERNVIASRSGRVVFLSDDFAGMGKTIIMEHADGFFTVYSLNQETFVRPGDLIQQGAVIARAGGDSGYLHFEIRKGHLPKNPFFYLT
jgi:lipoprotein NlpD